MGDSIVPMLGQMMLDTLAAARLGDAALVIWFLSDEVAKDILIKA